MKTRMQPIGNVWSKFPRVVRDLSVSCGKQVRVEMEGTETELDKTIIEAIKEAKRRATTKAEQESVARYRREVEAIRAIRASFMIATHRVSARYGAQLHAL